MTLIGRRVSYERLDHDRWAASLRDEPQFRAEADTTGEAYQALKACVEQADSNKEQQ